MEKLLLVSHATAGGIVLILGLINLINRKGSKNHVLLGKIYVGAMWWICLSAFSIILFYRFSFFLMVIGILTFYSSFVGVRVVRRKTSSSSTWYDWAVSIVTVLFGIGLVLYGINFMLTTKDVVPLGILSILFGTLTTLPAFRDLRNFTSRNPDNKLWWLQQHISAMGGSYIAAITAFAVQNSSIFLPNDYSWIAWVLPSLLFSPLLRMLRKRHIPKAG